MLRGSRRDLVVVFLREIPPPARAGVPCTSTVCVCGAPFLWSRWSPFAGAREAKEREDGVKRLVPSQIESLSSAAGAESSLAQSCTRLIAVAKRVPWWLCENIQLVHRDRRVLTFLGCTDRTSCVDHPRWISRVLHSTLFLPRAHLTV